MCHVVVFNYCSPPMRDQGLTSHNFPGITRTSYYVASVDDER